MHGFNFKLLNVADVALTECTTSLLLFLVDRNHTLAQLFKLIPAIYSYSARRLIDIGRSEDWAASTVQFVWILLHKDNFYETFGGGFSFRSWQNVCPIIFLAQTTNMTQTDGFAYRPIGRPMRRNMTISVPETMRFGGINIGEICL
jgi:hypothetical protein